MELLRRLPLDVAFKLIGTRTAGVLNRLVWKDSSAALKIVGHC